MQIEGWDMGFKLRIAFENGFVGPGGRGGFGLGCVLGFEEAGLGGVWLVSYWVLRGGGRWGWGFGSFF